MKNLKVGKKLILSFVIVIVLTVFVGAVGIIGMMQINQGSTEMYENQLLPLSELSYAREYFQRLRVQMRNVALASGDHEAINEYALDVADRERWFLHHTDRFRPVLVDPSAIRLFDEAITQFRGEFSGGMDEIIAGARAGVPSYDLLTIMSDQTAVAADIITDNLGNIFAVRLSQASDTNIENDALFTSMLIIIVVMIVIAVLIAALLAVYISGLISKPLGVLTDFMKNAARTGDITLRNEDVLVIQKFSQNKDELGECIAATAGFVDEINKEMSLLEKIAEGDLTVEPNILSDKDKIGIALKTVADNLNRMFSEIQQSTSQVATGSKQIADGSQTLAQGSTEQAASVQELSSSISEIAQKTKENADMAVRTAMLASEIKTSAEKGSRQMGEMMAAVKDINTSSQNISKVIKSIDDIAFQTNILALNAAVEAARAGQHGKGFAVVAEEVRNLAAKSAEAAKDTENLIADSIEKAELGSRIADETSASLTEIVTGIGESSKLVSDIAKSSENQSASIAQINT
ncbi:MAG: methyl-accepting chemotaxis protein, partial [Oscillospiraceae bacterium]|nr:methyl-accepting chemotaxis protein [Oscillospiraceae bacterium]